jgi:hypothetical protein
MTKFSLGCRTDDHHWNELEMQITVREGELHITGEHVGEIGENLPLYLMDRPSQGLSTDAGVAYNNFARGGNKPHVTVSDQMAVFVQFESAVRFEAGHKKAQETIPAVAKRLHDSVMSVGNTLDPAQQYRNFRGRDPDVKAYLRDKGFPTT